MLNMLNYETYLVEIIKRNRTAICCENMSEDVYVIIPKDGAYNKEYVDTINMPTIYSSHAGGALVLSPGDIAFTWIIDNRLMPNVIIDVCDFLKKFNKNITINGNDIMLNDKKILGTMSIGDTIYYEGLFFSFEPDINVIENVTMKEIKKTPLGLSSLGVTKQDIILLIEDLSKKYDLKFYGGDK